MTSLPMNPTVVPPQRVRRVVILVAAIILVAIAAISIWHATKLPSTPTPTQQTMQYFQGRGLSRTEAAAMTGNLLFESNLNPKAENLVTKSYGGVGGGIAMWQGPRFKELQAYANRNLQPWDELQTQLDFIWWELNGPSHKALYALHQSNTLKEAVVAVETEYFKAAVPMLDQRLALAEQAYQEAC